MKLAGKVALVTGASSGIGREISLRLAREGAVVALLARSKKKLENLKKEIEEGGGKAIVASADLRNEREVEEAVNGVVSNNGIHILVNNAGLGKFKEVQEMSIEEWDMQVEVMLRGTFLTTKFTLPHMYGKRRGHIINISSKWALERSAMAAGYTASKFGIRGFTLSLREEARKHNVKVTNVMPGTVETPFFEKTEWEHDFTKALQPEDIAKLIADILKYPDRMVVEEVLLEAIDPDRYTYGIM